MIELKGKYSKAKIFIDRVESEVGSQVFKMLNHVAFKGSKIRIMPDTHAGKGCVIGFTASNLHLAIPNVVGVDIGCSMLTVNLGDIELNLEEVDNFIKNNIPSGSQVNQKKKIKNIKLKKDISKVCEKLGESESRHLLSVGSLGGGNHFIEIAVGKNKEKYLILHSGSRNFGLKVAKYHQNIAYIYCDKRRRELREEKNKWIGQKIQANEDLSSDLNQASISAFEKREEKYKVEKELSFLEGSLMEDYINDMNVAMRLSTESKKIMAKRICDFIGLDFKSLHSFETMHNYYDSKSGTIRKGAISAKEGEVVLIPLNMRDGSILARGKGNPDWNNSAPHGAGRIMSRSKAKELLNISDFEDTMKGVYSTSVLPSTLDEAPSAYKDKDDILSNVSDTIDIIDILKPIYNFKAHK